MRFPAWMLALLLAGGAVWAQDEPPPPESASKPPVAITFTPPDLAGEIVLGIFNEAGGLVRTLRFEPGSADLVVDTNGYIAKWDGRDDRGASCNGGRYYARGYVVGEGVKVEGEAFHFNDWMAQDQIPATGVTLRRWPDGFGVELKTVEGNPVFAKIRADGGLQIAEAPPADAPVVPSASPAKAVASVPGRDGSRWMIAAENGQCFVVQVARDGSTERRLLIAKDEPQPVDILASTTDDAILLKETGPGGLERVRELRRADAPTAADKDGRIVADWEVAFERTWQPCGRFGVVDGKLVADAGASTPANILTVPLLENALDPGRKQQLRLAAGPTQPGSALFAVGDRGNGPLKLVEVSSAGNWNRLVFGGGDLRNATLFQGDGIVVEEFSVTGLDQFAAFDAGSFLLAAPGPPQ